LRMMIQSKNGFKVISMNRRKAIRELCLNCSAWSAKEVENCQHTDCPLYPYRTGRGKQNSQLRSRAIREYCLWCMAGSAREVGKCTTPYCPLFPYRQSTVDNSVEIPAVKPKNPHIRIGTQRENEKGYNDLSL